MRASGARAAWVALAMAVVCGCDDGASPGATPDRALVDAGDHGVDGAVADADAGCVEAGDCAGGQVCVEGRCADCVADCECGAGGACVDGRCCAPGASGCRCGAGCGDDLSCVDARCAPCPWGSAGCPCAEGARCGDDLLCEGQRCAPCPWGEAGCPCDDGGCGAGLACAGDRCVAVVPPSCAALDCAGQGRRCVEDPEPACGACDLAAGYVDDGAGGCERPEGICNGDADCAGEARCIRLAPGEARCVPPPACALEAPGPGEGGRAWSPIARDCVVCPPCDGAGETGRLWPTTSAAGDCVCETRPGFYADVAAAGRGAQPCDADGDGWVQYPARQYVRADDFVLRENARCTIDGFATVVLHNERGETRALAVAADLGVPEGRLERLEPLVLDDPAALALYPFVGPWGDADLAAAQLNPLTKICASADGDHNGNGLPDVAEHGGAGDAVAAWMRPFLRIAHFVELHETRFEPGEGGAPGAIHIAEKPRCGAFPLAYTGAADRWRECVRSRPGDYAAGHATYDLAEWSCDAAAGACPPIAAGALGAAGAACSAEADATFHGMDHHSQFVCALFADVPDPALRHVLPVAGHGRDFDGNRCGLRDGALACAVEAPVNGAVGWAAIRGAASIDGYTRGCLEGCPHLLPTCPGWRAGAGNAAGCSNDDADFGALVCNRCPRTGERCDTGRPGVCAPGRLACDDGRDVCVGEREAAAADAFGDGVDENCDGFDGEVARSIFVLHRGAPGPRVRGTPEEPYVDLQAALFDAAGRTVYVDGGEVALPVSPLFIGDGPVVVEGGMVRGDDPRCGGGVRGWCRPDGAPPTIIRGGAPAVRITVDATLRRFEIHGEGGDVGGTRIGAWVQAAAAAPTTVVFEDVVVTAADGADGRDAPALPPVPRLPIGGAPGVAGCEGAGIGCANDCAPAPPPPFVASLGAPCACDDRRGACDGGDGGQGGVLNQGCDPTTEVNSNLPAPLRVTRGDDAPGPRGGVGGAVGGACLSNNDPNYTGTDGRDGGDGAAGAAGAGAWIADGWRPGRGGVGAPGENGGGGGGGGGGNGAGAGAFVCPQRGGSGGGGGAGGCGGEAGLPGDGGGASIGLLVRGPAALTLRRSPITAGDGGAGGDARAGHAGSLGGFGGRGTEEATNKGHDYHPLQGRGSNGARGGDGGDGGDGGPGGGGGGGGATALLTVAGAPEPVREASPLDCGPGGGGGASPGNPGLPGPRAAGCITRVP